jgi:hypothetical protein
MIILYHWVRNNNIQVPAKLKTIISLNSIWKNHSRNIFPPSHNNRLPLITRVHKWRFALMLIISSSPLYHPGYNGYNACYIMVFPAARLLVHLPHPEAPVRRKPGSPRAWGCVKLPMKKDHMAGFHSHGGPPNGWFSYMFIMETLIYKWMISHGVPPWQNGNLGLGESINISIH